MLQSFTKPFCNVLCSAPIKYYLTLFETRKLLLTHTLVCFIKSCSKKLLFVILLAMKNKLHGVASFIKPLYF